MNDLQGFLSQASAKIGVSPGSAESATGALLDLVGKQAGEAQLSALTEKIPGTASLVGKGAQAGELSGGIGSLAKGLSGSIGGKLGGAASVLGALQQFGLDPNQSAKFASMFFSFAKSQAGAEIVGKILGKMPELKKLIG